LWEEAEAGEHEQEDVENKKEEQVGELPLPGDAQIEPEESPQVSADFAQEGEKEEVPTGLQNQDLNEIIEPTENNASGSIAPGLPAHYFDPAHTIVVFDVPRNFDKKIMKQFFAQFGKVRCCVQEPEESSARISFREPETVKKLLLEPQVQLPDGVVLRLERYAEGMSKKDIETAREQQRYGRDLFLKVRCSVLKEPDPTPFDAITLADRPGGVGPSTPAAGSGPSARTLRTAKRKQRKEEKEREMTKAASTIDEEMEQVMEPMIDEVNDADHGVPEADDSTMQIPVCLVADQQPDPPSPPSGAEACPAEEMPVCRRWARSRNKIEVRQWQ